MAPNVWQFASFVALKHVYKVVTIIVRYWIVKHIWDIVQTFEMSFVCVPSPIASSVRGRGGGDRRSMSQPQLPHWVSQRYTLGKKRSEGKGKTERREGKKKSRGKGKKRRKEWEKEKGQKNREGKKSNPCYASTYGLTKQIRTGLTTQLPRFLSSLFRLRKIQVQYTTWGDGKFLEHFQYAMNLYM